MFRVQKNIKSQHKVAAKRTDIWNHINYFIQKKKDTEVAIKCIKVSTRDKKEPLTTGSQEDCISPCTTTSQEAKLQW